MKSMDGTTQEVGLHVSTLTNDRLDGNGGWSKYLIIASSNDLSSGYLARSGLFVIGRRIGLLFIHCVIACSYSQSVLYSQCSGRASFLL